MVLVDGVPHRLELIRAEAARRETRLRIAREHPLRVPSGQGSTGARPGGALSGWAVRRAAAGVTVRRD
ncbi:hypothetical protein [Kitasatospora aureofaciens]|uniref:hypothetical protein n=1 Tax=Kitasatospora aureofaciens TaxID=1894 RepID=UPI001C48C63A|nr:hypothetical protein [Kitasatospora aureofaciens]MBV6701716.1 hypothetical protein [Kitasatospora aureofaciens]